MFYKSVDLIIEEFEEDGFPYFIVKDSKDICGYNRNNKDMDKASDKLRSILEHAMQDPFGTKYTVVVAEKPITDITKVAGRVYKIVSPKQNPPERQNYQDKATYYGQYINPALEPLMRKIEELELKLQQKQLEEATEDEEDLPVEPNTNYLGEIIKNPQIQNALAGMFARLIDGDSAIPKAVAGIPDQVKINQAIEILSKHDDRLGEHLLTLAQIAESDNQKFNFLLSMLDNV